MQKLTIKLVNRMQSQETNRKERKFIFVSVKQTDVICDLFLPLDQLYNFIYCLTPIKPKVALHIDADINMSSQTNYNHLVLKDFSISIYK